MSKLLEFLATAVMVLFWSLMAAGYLIVGILLLPVLFPVYYFKSLKEELHDTY